MPTMRDQRVASELRRLRGEVPSSEVQRALGITPSKLSRIESCHVRARPDDVRRLATFYGADTATVERLVSAAEAARQPVWWTGVVGPDWDQALGKHLELESDAVRIDSWMIDLVPGLLQTPDYVRALIGGRPDVPAEQIARRMELRAMRRARVERGDLELWVVLDESVLWREIGGRGVLAGQLRYLHDAPANVTVQVLPFTAGAHPGLGTAFHVLRFRDWPPMLYQDTITRGLYQEDEDVVSAHERTMEHVRATALSQRESRAALTQRIEQLEGRDDQPALA